MLDVQPKATSPAADWLVGGAEMGKLIRSMDWSKTPLGPLASWPQCLRTLVGVVLTHPLPTILLWGPDLVQIYNDGYRVIAAGKHPAALGMPTRQCWPEAWHINGPIYERVTRRGESVLLEDQPFTLARNGVPEDTYFTVTYSPVSDGNGGGGVFLTVMETTAKVLAARERDRLLAQLDAERVRLAEVFRRSPSFMTVMRGPDHVFELANDRYYQLVGHRELVGKSAREAFPEVEGQGFFELLDRVYATGEPFVGKDMRIMLQRQPGRPPEERFVEFVYQPTRDPGGAVTGVFAHGVDLTDRVRAEAAVRESAERLRAVFEQSTAGIAQLDMGGRFVLVNQWFCDLVGYAREELLGGVRMQDITHPEDVGPNLALIDRAKADGGGYRMEKRYVRRDGSAVWISVSGNVLRGADGTPQAVLGVVTDLTERKRAEEALRESEERLRLGLDAGKTGTWDWDIANNKVTWSERVYEFHGVKPGEFGGSVEEFAKLIHPEDAAWVSEAIQKSVREGTPYEVEFRVVHASGEVHWIATSGKVYYAPDGRPLRMLGATSDVTARRRAEAERERLLASERAARAEAERASRMKDEFLATLSHELRTPLNAILGWSQILAGGGRDDEDLAEGLRTIERNARAQTQIIEDLLDMSRIINGKVRLDVRRVDLTAVVRAAVETLKPAADAKGVELQAVLDPLAVPVSGDPDRLQQVFWNLLTNAVKFTPRGGRVRVLLERVDSHLEVSVIDTGEGIRPDFLPHVFDRFRQSDGSTTRRHGGLGLGLAIVKQLVELHGGSIRAKSPGEGHGSTFTVSLPVTAVHAEPDPSHERQHPSARKEPVVPDTCARIEGVKVLVVDDEPDARSLMKRLLEDCKAVVTVAGSAAEAFERLQSERPDVLVSDVGMPEEDGYSLIQRVRGLGSDRGGETPAVALTAYARAEDRVKAVMAGFQHHVAKPVDPAELIAMIASLSMRKK